MPPMPAPPANRPAEGSVDLHAHIFPAGLPQGPGFHPWPTLVTNAGHGQIMVGASAFRHVDATLWSLPARLAHLDEQNVELQLVSPVPVMMTYAAPARAAARYMRTVNEGIAEQVRSSSGRLLGLGTVPLQDTDLAVRELEHSVRDLGLAGVEIGTVVGSRELDDFSLVDFFAAAADLNARLFVHPMDGGAGVIRRAGQPYDFGLGMLTDTALAAGALIFGGVLERHPEMKVLLAHGGGSFAWAYPRLRLLAATTDKRNFDALVRRLYVDCLVFEPAHLAMLGNRFGAEHVTIGTDFPFFPDQEQANAAMLAAGVGHHGMPADMASSLVRDNGLRFLGLSGRNPAAGSGAATSAPSSVDRNTTA